MTSRKVPVLIVGAGLAGLAAAVLLSWRGVPCLVAERRSAPSRHPRAHGLDLRTLELLRVVPGLESDLRAATREEFNDFTIVIAESVGGRELAPLSSAAGFGARNLSPATICSAGQDRIEPILLRHARARGAEILHRTELFDLVQEDRVVHARLRQVETGKTFDVSADFVIATDGTDSTVRNRIGIPVTGPGAMSHSMSILFEADLGVAMRNRSFVLYYLQNPEFVGTFVSSDDKDRGQLDIEYDPLLEGASEFGQARCKQMIRAALGMPSLDVTILEVVPWVVSGLVADRMAKDNIFLAGDAAHTMPPFGGLGGQVAMQDAADLAWKLALVVKGHAGPALLETYEAERHPVARLTTARQIANWMERIHPDRVDRADPAMRWDSLAVAMGYRYRSPTILDDGTDDGAPVEDPRAPSGSPGTRLAHVPLLRETASVSTLDLMGSAFVLLAGPDGSAWTEVGKSSATRWGVPVEAYRIGADLVDATHSFGTRTGIGPNGALLMRPDGFIAWRSRAGEADPASVLDNVLARVLCRKFDEGDR